jgi:regulator of RNase E activity RraA
MPRPSEKFTDLHLPFPDNVSLPIEGPAFRRPDPALIARLRDVSSATASAMLHKMGIRQTYIEGPLPRVPGAKVVGPAVTLQFMPQREDIASGLAQEHAEKVSALWAVFDAVQPGDILVVQAWGDPYTGVMGDMLTTYFKGRGGAAVVVDGCVRDWPKIQELGVPMWTVGVTPNYASQSFLFPWAYNVPIACSRVLVMPGDIIIADDDGVVMVPAKMASMVADIALQHEEWEVFSRIKLSEGGALRKYYPINEEGWAEYEEWRKQNPTAR